MNIVEQIRHLSLMILTYELNGNDASELRKELQKLYELKATVKLETVNAD